jgi:mRNA-degrading endonuclease RelE of RelBE toxin-antitoxin system
MTGRTNISWRVEIQDRFYKKLARLPRTEREIILTALNDLQSDPFAFLKPLCGRTDWRLRVGAWRILLRIDVREKVIVAYVR